VKYTKKALTKQGCDAVVFEVPNSPGIDFYEYLAEARRKCKGLIFFYIKDEKIPREGTARFLRCKHPNKKYCRWILKPQFSARKIRKYFFKRGFFHRRSTFDQCSRLAMLLAGPPVQGSAARSRACEASVACTNFG